VRRYADEKYQKALEAGEKYLSDFKIELSPSELKALIGEGPFLELQAIFVQPVSEILIRRCSAHGQFIKFHTDVSKRTLQVALNGEADYVGGRLIFATNGILYAPERYEGTVSIHHNDIAHGVSMLESGIRYGLFFLQK
jgi:hypothetical protein